LHGFGCALTIFERLGNVIGVSRSAIADNFRQNIGSPLSGMLEIF
jgi:hypothetical protein